MLQAAPWLWSLLVPTRPAAHDPGHDATGMRKHDLEIGELLEQAREDDVGGSESGLTGIAHQIDQIILAERWRTVCLEIFGVDKNEKIILRTRLPAGAEALVTEMNPPDIAA